MSVMMIWTLELDPARVDEALRLVAERRVQVERHSCRDLPIYRVLAGDTDAANRVIAIEEFESQDDLDSFIKTQPRDAEAQATIAKTFAPVGPFSVVDMYTVEDFDLA
jgi:hypothetical protein